MDTDQPLTTQQIEQKVAEAVGLSEPEVHVSKIVDQTETYDYLPVQEYYGVEEPTDKQIEQLKIVWEYYSKDAEDTGDVLKKIRAAHMNLVQPEIGQTKLSQLADYIKIVKLSESAEKQKQAYQRLVKDK